jgi:hypothetical protein
MVVLNYEELVGAIKESGLKKGILAHKMQIAPRTLTDSINERRLSVEYLVQICALIGRLLCEFFTGPGGEVKMVKDPGVSYGMGDLIELLKSKDEQIKMLLEQLRK